ncbi:MAG: hypothetical protein WC756_10490 [Taibaiella sp.]|jgi:hypothetical protein
MKNFVYTALGLLVLSYLINRHLIENSQNSSAVGNCLRYSPRTSIWSMPYLQDPILNRNNIAGFLGASENECSAFIDKILEAAQRGPLAQRIIKVTLGLRPELKIAVSSDVRTTGKALGTFFPDADAIIIYTLNEAGSKEAQPNLSERALTKPSSLLLHEITHAFNDLYNKHNDGAFSSVEFCKRANQIFAQNMQKIEKLRDLFNKHHINPTSLTADEKHQIETAHAIANQYKIPALEYWKSLFAFLHVVDFINSQLQRFTDEVIRTNEIFAHLMHFIPEGLIKEHFPFFHQQLEKMVTHFDSFTLLPRDGQLPEAYEYSYDYFKTQDICLASALPYLRTNLDTLEAQTRGALYNNHRSRLKTVVDYFEKDTMRCAINHLEPRDYARVHLMVASSHRVLGNYKEAYDHFKHAMKKAPEQFSEKDIEDFSEVAAKIDQPMNKGSFKRAMNNRMG